MAPSNCNRRLSRELASSMYTGENARKTAGFAFPHFPHRSVHADITLLERLWRYCAALAQRTCGHHVSAGTRHRRISSSLHLGGKGLQGGVRTVLSCEGEKRVGTEGVLEEFGKMFWPSSGLPAFFYFRLQEQALRQQILALPAGSGL